MTIYIYIYIYAIEKYFSQLLLVFLFFYDAYYIFGDCDDNFEDYNNQKRLELTVLLQFL